MKKFWVFLFKTIITHRIEIEKPKKTKLIIPLWANEMNSQIEVRCRGH